MIEGGLKHAPPRFAKVRRRRADGLGSDLIPKRNRSSRTPFKTPGATAPRSSTTAAGRVSTPAGAGWWIWCSARNSWRPEVAGVDLRPIPSMVRFPTSAIGRNRGALPVPVGFHDASHAPVFTLGFYISARNSFRMSSLPETRGIVGSVVHVVLLPTRVAHLASPSPKFARKDSPRPPMTRPRPRPGFC